MSWLGLKSSASSTQLFHNGTLINKPVEIADCLNNYFVNKARLIREKLSPPKSNPLAHFRNLMRNRSSSFKLSSVHPDIVEGIVLKLKNSKSTGLDNIDTQVIKLTLPFILPALTHIVNLSIEKCQFPTQWKVAKVIAL